MALPATSTFTGTNGTDLNSLSDWDGSSDNSLSGNGLEIQSNAAQGTLVTRAQGSWWTTDTFDADHYSQGVIAALASGTYIGVGCRMSGTDGGSNISAYMFYSDSADASYIDEYSAGAYQASSSGATLFSTSDTVRIEASGSTITGKVNGSTLITYTDSTLTTGAAGVVSYSNGASRIDDWEGGNLGGAPAGGTGIMTTNTSFWGP